MPPRPAAGKPAATPSSPLALQSSSWTTPDGTAATPAFLHAIQQDIIGWWAQHRRRDLPWRPHHEDFASVQAEPYAVWVSEVMSQQTRMDTVIRYFPRWMNAFPTVEAVAASSEDDVRRVWSGMGFYRRAMYLRRGAQYIVEQHRKTSEGRGSDAARPASMPACYAELLRVPGIGPYTAAAIASVCYGEAVAAVDGNVIRVLSRLRGERGVDPKLPTTVRAANAWGKALMLGQSNGGTATDETSTKEEEKPLTYQCAHPGAMNQGLMELGAAVCRPTGAPLCSQCPLRPHCTAHAIHQQGCIPAIEGIIPMRGSKTKMRDDTVVCVVHECKGSGAATEGQRRFIVVKRPGTGLLGGMLEFPSLTIRSELMAEAATAFLTPNQQRERDNTGKVSPEEERALRKLSLLPAGTRKGEQQLPAPISLGTVRHVFSHIDMLVHVYHVRWEGLAFTPPAEAEEEEEGAAAKKRVKDAGGGYNGTQCKAENRLCAALAAVLDAEESTVVIRDSDEGEESDAVVDVDADDGPGEGTGEGNPTGKRRSTARFASKDKKARTESLSPDPASERISILTESALLSAAPSRLCLKILRHVHPGSGAAKPKPRSPPPTRTGKRG